MEGRKEGSKSSGQQGEISAATGEGPDQALDFKRETEAGAEALSQDEKLSAVYRLTLGLAREMEKSRIAEYTQLLHSPWRLIWLNIISGIARGVGIALGFTFFAATIIYVLQMLGALNLPIIGDYIADIVRIVQHQLELKTF